MRSASVGALVAALLVGGVASVAQAGYTITTLQRSSARAAQRTAAPSDWKKLRVGTSIGASGVRSNVQLRGVPSGR